MMIDRLYIYIVNVRINIGNSYFIYSTSATISGYIMVNGYCIHSS